MGKTISHLTSKGQIVIPAKLRKKYGLKPGTAVSFSERGQDIVIHPQTPGYFRELWGIWGKQSNALDILIEERKNDNEREDAKVRRAVRSR